MKNKPLNISIIAADFHKDITDYMVDTALKELSRHNTKLVTTLRVPGSYEIPLAVKHIIDQGKTDAVVILAYIEKGQTLHGEVMGHVVHSALIQLQLEHNMPMGLGIIGPGATKSQAEKRKNKTAKGAVHAAINSYQTTRNRS
jgi:6,7-dimethyl-8-ribityllumazine synthase